MTTTRRTVIRGLAMSGALAALPALGAESALSQFEPGSAHAAGDSRSAGESRTGAELSRASSSEPGDSTGIALAFHAWARTPPMGWNSWDSFATTITESQAREVAQVMATKLKPHGYEFFTVDIQWYEPNATGFDYRKGAPLTLDEWGRLLPAPNRFPSAAQGKGFAPLAQFVHGLGLKFGMHLMRGIPRQAVQKNLPIQGTQAHAADIANKSSTCPWNTDMYGVDMTKPGAQEYYNSVFDLFAEWGVDFVKVDDMSRPYHEHEPEIEAVRRAIDRTGRPMVLSLSPGETPLDAADHVRDHANLWRISDDFWDTWPALLEQFARLEKWNSHRGSGYWPDADMLPLGTLELGKRQTRFTRDEQFTLMTLWSIARSPLIMGGDLRRLDDFTLSLLTNDEVLAVNQRSARNKPLFNRDGLIAWTADAWRERPQRLNTPQADMRKDSPARTFATRSDVVASNGMYFDTRPSIAGEGVLSKVQLREPAAPKRIPGGRPIGARPLDKYVAVFNTRDRGAGDPAEGVPVPVTFAELGILGPRLVRDLWQRRKLSQARDTFAPTIPWHGAGLYRLIAPMI